MKTIIPAVIACTLSYACQANANTQNTSLLVVLKQSQQQKTLSLAEQSQQLLQQTKASGINLKLAKSHKATKHILPNRLLTLEVPKSQSKQALAMLNSDPTVAYAEPNYQVSIDEYTGQYKAQYTENASEWTSSAQINFAHPNDPSFNKLWGLHNTGQTRGREDADIDAPEAWTITTGSKNIVVGVIDTGIDYTHEDLIDNMWVNPNEIPGDNIDNDNNGYVDDIYGINAIDDTGDPMDDHSHGTHVAGTIGAASDNNIGITGVNHHTSMIGCKFLAASGSGAIGNAIKCLDYYIDLKLSGTDIRLTNNSWGGGSYSQAMEDALIRAHQAGLLFVSSAGNAGSNNDNGAHYPSSYQVDSVLAVASTTHVDGLSSFSNYGKETVDLGAPGSDIYSTMPNNGYASKSGTSMASPHAAGAAALLLASNPGLTHMEVKSLLMSTGDPLSRLENNTVSGKRINLANAVNAAALPTWYLTADSNSQTIKQGESAELTFTATTINQWQGDIALSIEGQIEGQLNASFSVNPLPANQSTTITINSNEQTPVGTHQLELIATADGTTRTQLIEINVEHANQVIKTYQNNQSYDIPDSDSTGITSEVFVADNFELLSAVVEVDISHTWRGDLEVSLVHPDGQTTPLHQRSGGSANNLRKSYDISNLAGSSQGTWGLLVKDLSSRDVGTLNNWSLALTGTTVDIPVTLPTAKFFTSVEGTQVTFTDASTDIGDDIISWAWDFGDGNTSNEQNPTHDYQQAGLYSVSLTVTDSQGNSDTKTSDNTIGGFVLSLVTQTQLDNGDVKVDFNFDGSDAIFLSLYRDGRYQTSVFNIGQATDTIENPRQGSYVYKLCDSDGCSNDVTVVIE